MTIKSKLFIAFAVLVVLVVIMGSALVVFGLQNRKLSGSRVQHYAKLFFWREIYQTYDAQWMDLNYYMILGDQAEKDRAKDQFYEISRRITSMSPSWEELDKWYADYKKLNDFVDDSIKNNSREKLFKIFSGELNQKKLQLKSSLEGFIDYHTKATDSLEKQINNLNKFGIIFSVSRSFFNSDRIADELFYISFNFSPAGRPAGGGA